MSLFDRPDVNTVSGHVSAIAALFRDSISDFVQELDGFKAEHSHMLDLLGIEIESDSANSLHEELDQLADGTYSGGVGTGSRDVVNALLQILEEADEFGI